MTGEGLGPLGRRFLVAFAGVVLVTIGLVTAAGLVGSERGRSSQSESQRQSVAERVADDAAEAYSRAGGWDGADLTRAESAAEGGGAALVVRDAEGSVVWPDSGRGMHPGGMQGMGRAV